MIYIFTILLAVSLVSYLIYSRPKNTVIYCDDNFYPGITAKDDVWCAINTITGIKRCPKNGEKIIPDVNRESCTRRSECDFPILKYTVVPNVPGVSNPGSTVLDNESLNTKLKSLNIDLSTVRCAATKQCDNNTLAAWSLDNGKLTQVTGYSSYVGNEVRSAPLHISDSQFCYINPNLLVKSGVCSDFNDCAAKGNLCSMGKLTSVVFGKSTDTDQNQRRMVACMASNVNTSAQTYFTEDNIFKEYSV